MKHRDPNSPTNFDTTEEEELFGTPTVSLADALAKADEDAEEEEF